MPAVAVYVNSTAIEAGEDILDGLAAPLFEIIHAGHVKGVDTFGDDSAGVPLRHDRARPSGNERDVLEKHWSRAGSQADSAGEIHRLRAWRAAEEAARVMLHSFQREAVRALDPVRSASLKLILRRVIGKIFDDGVVMGCCSDNQAGNVRKSEPGSEASQ